MTKAKIVVCASGEGSGFEALVRASHAGTLQAEVVGLIVNRPHVAVLGRAERFQVPSKIIAPKTYSDSAAWDHALLDQLKAWRAEWVVLAGFLALVGPTVLAAFPQRVVNSHPALLPKFGGPGMYGDHVHQAVLNAGEQETGITIHLIDENYDQGRILAQERVPVEKGDTSSTLAARVKAREVLFYPRVLNDLVTGQRTIR